MFRDRYNPLITDKLRVFANKYFTASIVLSLIIFRNSKTRKNDLLFHKFMKVFVQLNEFNYYLELSKNNGFLNLQIKVELSIKYLS